MSIVEGLPSPESLARKMLVRRLSMHYGGDVNEVKACACIGASECDDLACPIVWDYWLTDDRMLKLIHLAMSARELHKD